MSRVNNSELKNPAKIFLEFSGKTGNFQYYDKARGEKGQNVEVPPKLNFMVLDILSTIRGFSDSEQQGIWSNEVNREAPSQILTVKTKSGVIAEGLWKNIGDKVKSAGGKFHISIYGAMRLKSENGEMAIICIMLKGSALQEFLSFQKGRDIYKGTISVTGTKEGTKGGIKFKVPVFAHTLEVSPESEAKAIELTNELGAYHAAYFMNNAKRQNTSAEVAQPAAQPQPASQSQSGGRTQTAQPQNTVTVITRQEKVQQTMDAMDVDFDDLSGVENAKQGSQNSFDDDEIGDDLPF